MSAFENEEQFFSLDVECFATGFGHSDRVPATVAVVNANADIIYEAMIEMEPGVHIVSYFTELTGITEDMYLSGEKKPLAMVVSEIKEILNENSVLVGQGIQNDVDWLKLCEGIDFKRSINLAEVFKVESTYKGRPQTAVYALTHVVQTLLPELASEDIRHFAAEDARKSMIVYNRFGKSKTARKRAHDRLRGSRPEPSWGKKNNYIYENVCLAGYFPEKCTCGQPSLKKV